MFLWGGGGGSGDVPGGESLVWTIVALLFYKTPAFPTLSPVLYPGSKEGLCLGRSALSDRLSSVPSEAAISYRVKIRFTSWVLGDPGA